jgi:hypothetical protein
MHVQYQAMEGLSLGARLALHAGVSTGQSSTIQQLKK